MIARYLLLVCVCTIGSVPMGAYGQDQLFVDNSNPECGTAVLDPSEGITLTWNPAGPFYRVRITGGPFYYPLDTFITIYGVPYGTPDLDAFVESGQYNNWGSTDACSFSTMAATTPANDEDCNATSLVSAPCAPITGTLRGANANDVWYTFQAGALPFTTINADPTGAELLQVTLYDGVCGGGLNELASAISYAPGAPARIAQSGSVEGATYYVRVASGSPASVAAEFDVCVEGGAQAFDCLGVVGGTALTGTTCDDGNPCTTNDQWGAACSCAGTVLDSDGDGTCDAYDHCPGGPEPGTPWDDGDPCTYADVWGWNCQGLPGVLLDSDGDGTPNCQDECPGDPNKILRGQCGCSEVDLDADGDGIASCIDRCEALNGNVGDPCPDGNGLINNLCECVVGAPPEPGYDCLGVLGGDALPGTPCTDPNAPCADFDGVTVWSPECTCISLCTDQDGDGSYDPPYYNFNGPPDCNPALPTGFWPPNCFCSCTLPNGFTGSWNGNQCVAADCGSTGLVPNFDIDQDGILFGMGDECVQWYGQVGWPCQDGDPLTVFDVITANCNCVGELAVPDCEGVPGGPAQPGTLCDDGLPNTVTYYDPDCICQITNVGVEEQFRSDAGFVLAPNPLQDGMITLATAEPWSEARIEVVDVFGRRVYERSPISIQKRVVLDLTALASGQYIVRLSDQKRRASHRLLISR